MRRWDWIIITVPRRCVVCDGKIPGGSAALEARYRGKITLCKWCREALDKDNRIEYSGEKELPELMEGFDIDEL